MFGFGGIGPFELLLILVVALVVFGPKRLPEIGKAIGQAIRGLKEQSDKLTQELNMDLLNDEPGGQARRDAPSQPEVASASEAPALAPVPASDVIDTPRPDQPEAAPAVAAQSTRRRSVGHSPRAPRPSRAGTTARSRKRPKS